MSFPRNYFGVLEDDQVVVVESMLDPRFTFQFENPSIRIIERTALVGDIQVSTVFLGINHGWPGQPDLWFETMIFGGPHDLYQERYSTIQEAREGHIRAVKLATDWDL